MTFFEELQWRGLVKDVAGEDIADKLNNEKSHFTGEPTLQQTAFIWGIIHLW